MELKYDSTPVSLTALAGPHTKTSVPRIKIKIDQGRVIMVVFNLLLIKLRISFLSIAFIDHYDSFSFNVLDWLRSEADSHIEIQRIACDNEIALMKIKKDPVPLVISPGPGNPSDYPETLKLIEMSLGKVPVFGLCLGHQMLIQLAGGSITKAKSPWHGVPVHIRAVADHWISQGLPPNFQAISYNSLVGNLPARSPDWQTIAVNDDQEIMIMGHQTLDVAGVQFHPESFDQDALRCIARNFLARCGAARSSN